MILKIPIYNHLISLELVDNIKDHIIRNELSDDPRDYSAVVFDYTRLDEDYHSLALFSNDGIRSDTIAHEAFHIVCLITKDAGIKLSDYSEEAYAYLLGYVVRLLTTNLIKLKQEKNGDSDTPEKIRETVSRSAAVETIQGLRIFP